MIFLKKTISVHLDDADFLFLIATHTTNYGTATTRHRVTSKRRKQRKKTFRNADENEPKENRYNNL